MARSFEVLRAADTRMTEAGEMPAFADIKDTRTGETRRVYVGDELPEGSINAISADKGIEVLSPEAGGDFWTGFQRQAAKPKPKEPTVDEALQRLRYWQQRAAQLHGRDAAERAREELAQLKSTGLWTQPIEAPPTGRFLATKPAPPPPLITSRAGMEIPEDADIDDAMQTLRARNLEGLQ